jgi:hypothetical protein
MRHLVQMLLVLLALWTVIAGILIAVVGGDAAKILTGVEDNPAATHLIGAHYLLVSLVYIVLIRNLEYYRWLLWFPVAAQAAVLVPAVYDFFAGNRDFEDAIVPILVTIAFFGLTAWLLLYREHPGMPGAAAPPAGGTSASPPQTAATPDLAGGRFKRTVGPGSTRKPEDTDSR